MADANQGGRPLSPHVFIYRWPLNAILSILHRATGVAMAVSAILVVWWFLAASSGAEYFATVDWLLTSFIGDVILFLSLLSLCFHMVNGVRHLIWDTGSWMGQKRVRRTAIAGVVTAVVLALIVVIVT